MQFRKLRTMSLSAYVLVASIAAACARELRQVSPAPGATNTTGGPDVYRAELFTPYDGTCPKEAIINIPTARHKPAMKAPQEAIAFYEPGQLDAGGKFPMEYYTLINGESYCVSPNSDAQRIIVGGNVLWETTDGTCVEPPTTATGESCCTVFMWQPNAKGLYYDNCSMRMDIEADGFYYFETEMPGDESVLGWGADPEAHIHYDFVCKGCAPSKAFDGTEYTYWGKFYQEQLCTHENCGNTMDMHKSSKKTIINNQVAYKFDFVLSHEPRGPVMDIL